MVCRSRCMVCRSRCMVGRGRCMVRSRIIVCLSLIGDLSHKAVIVVSMVGDMLGPTIRQGHTVGALHCTTTISCLPSMVVSSRVVIMHTIFIAVGFGLFLHWVVGRGRGMVDWCRGVVGWCRGVVGWCWGMVGRRWSMVAGFHVVGGCRVVGSIALGALAHVNQNEESEGGLEQNV